MLNDHKFYFTEKDVSRLCPGELFAYNNATIYRLGDGCPEWRHYSKDYATLEEAIADASKLNRPIIHAVALRDKGDIVEECFVLVPISLPKRFTNAV